MKMRLIPAIALMAAILSGGAFSAHALPAEAANKAEMETVANPDYKAAMAKYERQLADYRKDLVAYEADPGEWTAEVPRMPTKPDVPAAVARKVGAQAGS